MIGALGKFVRKFWLQNKQEDPERQSSLPLSNVVDLNYHSVIGEVTRIFTVELYTQEGAQSAPKLVAVDDGLGGFVEKEAGVLDTSTGILNTIDYENNLVTITWDPTFLGGLTNPPFMRFKIVLDDEESHAEMKDFLEFVLETYKTQELDAQKTWYKPNEVPQHLLDLFAGDHNWILDRTFSEEDSYLRLQLRFLYDFYKHKRRLDGVKFGASVINRVVTLSNMLSHKGSTEEDTANLYKDFSQYVRFNTDAVLAFADTDPDGVQDIYDTLYSEVSDLFPTKHYLLDMAIDRVNPDGSILRVIDIATLRFYTLANKAKSQYPHFAATLGITADSDITEQDASNFDFLLTEDEAKFSINNFESIISGPNGVFSIGLTGTGAWVIFPFVMNDQHAMNSGFVFNMDISDLGEYVSSFKLGLDSYGTLTNDKTDLKAPFFSSTNVKFLYEGNNAYFIAEALQPEANDVEIKEMGLFNGGGQLVFYVKHPVIIKKDTHTLVYKIKLNTILGTGP